MEPSPGTAGSKRMPTAMEQSREDKGRRNSSGYKVTANSALSEYLAVNMMNGKQMISLEDFPESADTSYLLDGHGRKWYTRIWS